MDGGGAGIRTLGTLRYAGFQDRCFRPLSHPSVGGNYRLAGGCRKLGGAAVDSPGKPLW